MSGVPILLCAPVANSASFLSWPITVPQASGGRGLTITLPYELPLLADLLQPSPRLAQACGSGN